MSSIEVLKDDDHDSGSGSQGRKSSEASPSPPLFSKSTPPPPPVVTISEGTSTEAERVDEVFEAVITREDVETRDAGEQTDDELSDSEKRMMRMQTEQSERLLRELRSVLAVKAREREEREAAAVARKNGGVTTNCQKEPADQESATGVDGQSKKDGPPPRPAPPGSSPSRPKKPPRARNGELKNGGGVRECAEDHLVKAFPAVVHEDRGSDKSIDSQEPFAKCDFPPPPPAKEEAASNNAFEDSFSEFVLSEEKDGDGFADEEEGEPDSTATTSSSSDQATVKTASSFGREGGGADDSSSSYEESDEEESESVAVVGPRGDNHNYDSGSLGRDRKKKSRLRNAPSLDSLHDSRMHLMKKKGEEASGVEKKLSAEGAAAAGDCHSLSELRSISSPDIKKLAGKPDNSYTSQYENLEAPLPPSLRVAAAFSSSARLQEQREAASASEESSESSEESNKEKQGARRKNRQVLKTYRRPLRPAAMKKGQQKSANQDPDAQSAKRKSKRLRNRTLSLEKDEEEQKGAPAKNGISGHPNSRGGEDVDSSNTNGDNASSYAARKNTKDSPLFVPPKRPFGFDAAVALQAARKAMSGGFRNGAGGISMPLPPQMGRGGGGGQEEVFGDSSSGAEDGKED